MDFSLGPKGSLLITVKQLILILPYSALLDGKTLRLNWCFCVGMGKDTMETV